MRHLLFILLHYLLFLLLLSSSYPRGIDNKSASSILINFYQNHISPINQSKCLSYPSCSAYSKEAINRYGFYGFLLTADRLNRCGHDLNKVEKKIIINNSVKYYDPVP